MLVLAQKVKRVKHGDCIVPVIPSSHPQGKGKGKGEAMASTASATAVLARRGLCSSSPCARVAISSGSLQKFVGQKSTTSGGSNCRRCHLGSSFVSRSWRAVVSSGTSQSGDFAALSESIALLRRFYGVQAARQRPVVTASSASPVGTIVTESSSGVEASTAGDVVEPLSWRASIDFKGIRENKDAIAANIINRKSSGDVELVVRLYEQSVQLSMEVDKLRAERNAVASAMKGKLEQAKRQELINQGKELKDRLAGLEVSLGQLFDRLQREGQRIPNMTHPSVPIGSEDVATVRKLVGEKPDFLFPVKSHVELGQELDLFDFESAAEVSGNKFYYLKNEAVLLEMALINWTLSELIKRGFTPLTTPDLVRSSVVEKCGFQPRGQNTQVYSVEDTDLCLAGTAEIPVGGMYMDSMLTEAALPLRIVAFSHCFRTEAGAAGSATRGLYRVHQFSKLEMFAICKPEESEALHEELISIEEELYMSLGLHFKTLDMSSEDLGAPAHRKYDVEAWMPGLDRYGEVSSASNCTDYQSRRLNIRYRPEHNMMRDGPKTKLPPPVFAHTLNATACAVPRMIIAILENFQQVDGSVVVPEPLRPFMGGIEVITPKVKK